MIQGGFRRIIAALLLIAAAVAPLSSVIPAGASQPAAPVQAAAISAITQRATLRPTTLDPTDMFGMRVVIDGQTAVIAAIGDDGPTNATKDAGAVYVFGRTANGGWAEQAVLRAANPDSEDYFGLGLAIDGDTIVVGAPLDDGASNSNTNTGAVYVFVRSNGGWTQQAVLREEAADPEDRFGEYVDVSGSTLVVSAPQDDGFNNELMDAGAAYVFARGLNGVWSRQGLLSLAEPRSFDNFGSSVAIDGDRIAVGAALDDGPNNDKEDSGSVTIFVRSNQSWNDTVQLNMFGGTAMEADDRFGGAVALDGTTLVVGAYGDAGIDNTLNDAGAAYVYSYIAAIDLWSPRETLRTAAPASEEYFGRSVAVDGDTIVVGAPYVNISDTIKDAGAAYVFNSNYPDWEATGTLRPSSLAANDWFGQSVALSGGYILGGAAGDDGPRTLTDIGAAFVYFRSTAQVYIPLIKR